MNWISVNDRLPNLDEGDILCCSMKFGRRIETGFCVILWYDNGVWKDDLGNNYESNADYHLVTHWMPLPETPNN